MGKKQPSFFSDNDLKCWLLEKSYRTHCWIVESQFADITQTSEFVDINGQTIERPEPFLLKYTYSTHVVNDNLLALIEDSEGRYYLIRNQKENVEESEEETHEKDTESEKDLPEVVITSTIAQGSLIQLLKNLSESEKHRLGVVKPSKIKIKGDTITKWTHKLPLIFADQTAWKSLLDKTEDALDLSGIFWVRPESFTEVIEKVSKLTLNQNFRITKFDFLKSTFPNLKQINLVNMPLLKDTDISSICQALPNIEDFSVHFCQRVTIRLMVDLMKLKNIRNICLNQADLACQTNAYSGLIGENEWDEITCPSITQMLINSTNMTLDVLDLLFPRCPNLNKLVLHPIVFQSLSENMVYQGPDPGLTGKLEFTVCSLDGRDMTIKRPYKILNRLKDKVAPLFSESMMNKVKALSEDDPELMAEVIAEMKANGEWSE